jgi:putative oxidoreductase
MLEFIRRNRASDRSHALARVPARAALGSAMLYHGVQKLRDTDQAARAFEGLGIKPAKPLARATALAETFAGAAALLGILTRPAALAVLVTQAVAIAKVHRPKGFDNTKGGFEYNLTLMAIAAGLLFAGPGHVSVREAVERAVTRRRFAGLVRPRRRRWSRALRIALMLLG